MLLGNTNCWFVLACLQQPLLELWLKKEGGKEGHAASVPLGLLLLQLHVLDYLGPFYTNYFNFTFLRKFQKAKFLKFNTFFWRKMKKLLKPSRIFFFLKWNLQN
jgi:hypothetical protein